MSASYDTRVRDILAKLVAFDTTSSKPNADLIAYIEDYLAGYGIRSQRFSAQDATVKACLWATIGPDDRGGYVLSGHTDVVPVEGQAWSSDPYTLVEKDGKLYGRGAVDMKGFVAACLAMVPEMAAAGLKTPLHLAFSYDEEVGCKGVRSLLAGISKLEHKPVGCFVGEPSMMDVVIGHKGKHGMRASFQGLACHSSLAPYGVNAIEYAADLIKLIQAKAQQLAESGRRDDLHKIPYSTGLTSMVQGGLSTNIVPEHCAIDFEFRAIAADDPRAINAEIVAAARETIEPRMKAVQADCGILFEETQSYPALDMPADAEIVTLAKSLTGRNAHSKVAFGTEAGLFQTMAGIPTVVVGPGSIEQAHKPDEYITIAQLAACGDFLGRLVQRCS